MSFSFRGKKCRPRLSSGWNLRSIQFQLFVISKYKRYSKEILKCRPALAWIVKRLFIIVEGSFWVTVPKILSHLGRR